MTISFKDVYQGEIFQKTQCIEQENNLMDRMAQYMQQRGYTGHHPLHKIWTRGSRQIIQCLVDDFFTCGDTTLPVAKMFDHNTTVVTDNWLTVDVPYPVLRLPNSFFGIYAYEPRQQSWQPTRRFGFCVNRIDPLRISVLCEMIDPDQDLVNFNCLDHTHHAELPDQLRDNFARYQDHVRHDRFDYWANLMPVRNHELTVEQVHVQSRLNVVMETYAGRDVVALSEKTWRALQTPAPFVVYAGQGSVQFLRDLGFDLQDDEVDHSYDTEVDYHSKIRKFAECAQRTVRHAPNFDRAQQAAKHNQQLLLNLRQQWPQDLEQWWPRYQEVTA